MGMYLYAALIALMGIMCQTAGSGAEGLRLIRQSYERGEPFDYLFLDLNMPEMDGLEVCRQIALTPELDHLRIILLTEVGQNTNRLKLNVQGVNKTIFKPVCPSDIAHSLSGLKPDKPASMLFNGQNGPGENEPDLSKLDSMRVLLAEDSVTNQEVAIRILEKLGCEVYLASDGLEALDLMRAAEYDCILMDCQMPNMDGYAATNAIRQGYHGIRQKDIFIIAMTAHAMQGDKQKCLQAGMNHYLSKPVTIKRVAEALSHCQQSRPSQEA